MRLILIVGAYCAAALVASMVTFGGTTLFSLLSGQRFISRIGDDLHWLGLFTLLTALFALLPAVTAIAIAEAYRIRSLLVHAVVSTAIGVVILIISEIRSPWFFHGPESIINTMRVLWIVGSTAGGATYWVIAGRTAGG